MTHFDLANPITVETDASDYAIAAIIPQISPDDSDLHPIAFYSRGMKPAELNYEIYDKELLAIFEAFQQWRNYLEGSTHAVLVLSDHKNLKYFTTTKQLTRQQVRWLEYLSGFNYLIGTVQDVSEQSPMLSPDEMMCTLVVTMYMHWLTPTTSSQCSNPVSYFRPLFWTLPCSSYPSNRDLQRT